MRRWLRIVRKVALAALFLAVAGAPGHALTLSVAGPATVLFDQERDACDVHDLPDAPARAFRNTAGELVLFAPNFLNRALVGPDLDHLKRDCSVRFEAAGSADPGLLDDRTWLQAFHTDNGRDVFALASASFIPVRHAMRCAAGKGRTDCWINGLAALQSTDGGQSFGYLGAPPGQIVFPPPEPYSDAIADPPGFITASNIVAWQGSLYTILWRRGGEAEAPSHNCLARAPSGDPLHWDLLLGGKFVSASDYNGHDWHAAQTACDAIGPQTQPVIRGVVFHEPTRTFVAVFQYRRPDWHGFGYAISADLVHWSEPRPLLQTDLAADAAKGEPYAAYPSIIDGDSADRNFGTMGKTARLVFVKFWPSGQPSYVRKLVSLPILVGP